MSAIDKSALLAKRMKQFCACCNGVHLPLWPIFATEDVAHPECADASEEYGFCRYCLSIHEKVIYQVEHLTDEDECPEHCGESAPDGPDTEDIVENIENNNPFDHCSLVPY